MLNKNIIAIGFALSIACLIFAGFQYPGGSPSDINSIGFSWTQNYISNLLDYKAVNGQDNPARPFAMLGAVLMGLATGWAFVRFSQKIEAKHYSLVIKYLGLLTMALSVCMTYPPIHDLTVLLSIFINLLVFFYITILLFRSKLTLFKILAGLFLLSFYGATYMYSARTGLEFMPLVQKITHIFQIVWVLGLEYFTSKEDFEHIKK